MQTSPVNKEEETRGLMRDCLDSDSDVKIHAKDPTRDPSRINRLFFKPSEGESTEYYFRNVKLSMLGSEFRVRQTSSQSHVRVFGVS